MAHNQPIYKLPILMGIFLISFSAAAQKVKISVDKITGDTIKFTPLEKIYGKVSLSGTVGELLQFSLLKDKTGTTICFAIRTGKTSVFSVDKESNSFIKLSNDSVATLTPLAGSVSDFSDVSYGSGNKIFYSLSQNNISLLKSNPVKFIRIQTSSGLFDYDIKGKLSEEIKEAVIAICN